MMPSRPCDRFIPVRSLRDPLIDLCFSAEKRTEASTNYSRIISPESSKYLKFTTPCNRKKQSLTDFLFKSLPKKEKVIRKQQTRKAFRILDAPDVVNNFYYNPMDWSKSNLIGIALRQNAYFLGEGKQIQELERFSNVHITCLKFHGEDSLCLLGENTGRIDVYDSEKMGRIRQINVHYNRIGVIQESDIPQAFLSGSKDKLIKLNDLRVKKADVATMEKHRGEICGLATTNFYLASGGNDNKVVIWDLRKFLPINQIKEHKSAVKAVAWCPWKTSLLASGGGREDRKIVLWNGNKNVIEQKIDTDSQIIALQWKEETKELISGHCTGQNSYCLVWKGLNIALKLAGHDGRLLGMKMNPNAGNELCTIASDETLRFWDINHEPNSKKKTEKLNIIDEIDCR